MPEVGAGALAPDAGDRRAPVAGKPDAVLDACVLVPSSLRGLLLNAAAMETFRPVWSEPILAEVRGTLIGKRMIGTEGWERLDRTLREAFPDALVPESRIRAIEPAMRNDPKDRHVLAAAVASGSPVVVTNNLKDFRPADLNRVGVRAVHPDAYLVQLLDRAPGRMAQALQGQVDDMKRYGRWTPEQFLGHLKGLGKGQAMAPRFAAQAEATLGIRAVMPPPRETSARTRAPLRTRDSRALGR
jgi:predicted nucleic acid-binding protein